MCRLMRVFSRVSAVDAGRGIRMLHFESCEPHGYFFSVCLL